MHILHEKRRWVFGRFYFSFWIIPLFFFALYFRLLPLVGAAFLAALCHEICHLCAAVYQKTAVREFAILPYGCRLTLKSTPPPQTEAFIALCGPLFNLAAFLFSPPGAFREMNLALFLLNVLPILPLDGGRILYAFLSARHGENTACRFLRRVGIVVGIGLFLLGLLVFAFSGNNVSLLLLTACLLGHSHASEEAMLTKSRTFCRVMQEPDAFSRTEEITAREYLTVRAVLEKLPAGRFSIVTVVDKSGNILGRFTQKQLANAAMEDIDRTLESLVDI